MKNFSEQLAVNALHGDNSTFMATNVGAIYYVETGSLDVFLVKTSQGEATGARSHLFRIDAGQFLPIGMRDIDREYGLLIVPTVNAQYRRLCENQFKLILRLPEYKDQAVALIDTFVKTVASFINEKPKDKAQAIAVNAVVSSAEQADCVYTLVTGTWVRVLKGSSFFLGKESLPLSSQSWFPLPHNSWVSLETESSLSGADTASLILEEDILASLNAFLFMLVDYAITNQQQIDADELERLYQKYDNYTDAMEGTLGSFLDIMQGRSHQHKTSTQDNALLNACKVIGEKQGIEFKLHPGASGTRLGDDLVTDIALASGVRSRKVALKNNWWVDDNGPMLAFISETSKPVALLPTRKGGYEFIDPCTGIYEPVNQTSAATFDGFAFMFYRSFPDRALSVKDMLRFATFGKERDLLLLLVVATGGMILGMFTPMATGHIFDSIIPAADQSQLLQMIFVLLVVACVVVLFQATKMYVMLRIESLMNNDFQAAVWDRVLKLPAPFFRDFTVGDLATRINGINEIRQMLSSSAVSALLSGIFAIFNVILLFYYSAKLALVACALVLFSLVFSVIMGYLGLKITRNLATIQGKVAGLVFQYLNGISKLRVAGAETRAFANWGSAFADQKRLYFRMEKIQAIGAVFHGVFPLLASTVIFTSVIMLVLGPDGGQEFTTGSFIAFSAAFGIFLSSILELAGTGIMLLGIIPLYERTKPILQGIPEVDGAKVYPGELKGAIEVNNVSFRYSPEGPLVLNNISLNIKQGEFVAVVGSSGSGKSTLLRLLLGFEKAHSGEVYFDSQNLADVDLVAVRQQFGVVLQNGRLMSGDIFNNIIGSKGLTLDDAWEAAKACGLDEDIKAMPMGMHSLVTEGGSTLSGGQRQRMLIARAIVSKPKILFFDEATSALDNRTQAIVSSSLDRLRATRLVVAHRLSTIVNADRIVVMERGNIVQSGTYQELMDQEGLFAELAKRQIA